MVHKFSVSVEFKCSMAALMIFISVINQMFDFTAIPQSFLHEHFQAFQNIHQISNFKVVYRFLGETLKIIIQIRKNVPS
jgi:hypothetical protein